MTDLEIHIPGQPFRQKRHRTNGYRRYDPSAGNKKTIQKALLFYKPTRPIAGPVIVKFEAYFQTPKSWSGVKQERHEGRYRPKTPDTDNIEKIYFDAMNGMIWEDDKQVVDCRVQKLYSMKPRTVIRVMEIEPVEA